MEARIPPQRIELEKVVLGSVLSLPGCAHFATEKLAKDDFHLAGHQLIYAAVLDMVASNIENIDITTVANHLENKDQGEEYGGMVYLMELTQCATSPNLEYHCDEIKDASNKRKMIRCLSTSLEQAYSSDERAIDLLGTTQSALYEIDGTTEAEGLVPVSAIVPPVCHDIDRMKDGMSLGITTGFVDLDSITTGLHRGDLTILAARPSMGKTALAIALATNAAKAHYKAAEFSLEMPKNQIIIRRLCAEARVNMHRLRAGKASKDDIPHLMAKTGLVSNLGIWVDDTPALTPIKMMSRARRMKKIHGLDLVIVDYLQLMRWHEKLGSREQEISNISRSLKEMAKTLDCHVVALSQLSRQLEMRKDKRPILSDLRESGAIEQDADNVVFLYRDSYYNKNSKAGNVVEAIVGKQRNGPCATVKLHFEPWSMRFENLAKREDDDN
jgi:replicative DNA helicase